jgi:hypothetical protein
MTKPHTSPITPDANTDAVPEFMTFEEMEIIKDMTEEQLDARYGKRIGPREIINEHTGGPVFVGRPRHPKITSELVRKLLEDFP